MNLQLTLKPVSLNVKLFTMAGGGDDEWKPVFC